VPAGGISGTRKVLLMVNSTAGSRGEDNLSVSAGGYPSYAPQKHACHCPLKDEESGTLRG
jgi:hypothetical protein